MTKTMTMPQRSPWGKVQDAYELAPGIVSVSTAGHGGIKVSPTLNKKIPLVARTRGGWYEEDCEWAIPYFVFSADINCANNGDPVKAERHSKSYVQAIKTLENYFPEFCMAIMGYTPPIERSNKLRELAFNETNKSNYVVISAYGGWFEHTRRPTIRGSVVVEYVLGLATIGGKRESDGHGGFVDSKWFDIPAERYAKREHGGYVIQPDDQERLDIPK